jgi:uncharacterized surface protein with fasciclin (FAS1) repeats
MMRRNMMCAAMSAMPRMVMGRMGRQGWSGGARSRGMAMGSEACGADTGRPKGWAWENMASRPPGKSVVESARAAGSFGSLLGALKAAGLDSALDGKGPFTVFAPNDDAFARVRPETLQGLLSNSAELAKVLKFHVVSGRLTSAELASVTSLRTRDGRSLALDLGQEKVGGARVIKPDLLCSNGVIHVIDSVLLPS